MGHCLGVGGDRHGGEFLCGFGGHGRGERKTNGLEVREADEVDEVLVFRLWRGLGGVVRCLGVGLKPPADADRQ